MRYLSLIQIVNFYSWRAISPHFYPQIFLKSLNFVVVDGTWKQKDLDTLVRAGWDEIYGSSGKFVGKNEEK